MYSPPPMDGFSPPPMSDFSPPPLSDMSPIRDFPPPINGFNPDEDEDIVDEDLDLPISDEQFDLTGLSDKMNSLELNKINNLPPREILELQKETESSRHMIISEAAIDRLEVSEESNSEDEPKSYKTEQLKPSLQNDNPSTDDSSDIAPPLGQVGESVIGELHVKESEGESEGSFQRKEVFVVKTESFESHEEPQELKEPQIEPEYEKEPDDIQLEASEEEKEDWGGFANTKDDVEVNSNWGNFESMPPANEVEPSVNNRDIEFDDSDDEFGDFGEITAAAPVQVQSMKASEHESILKSLELLSEKSEELLKTVFESFITTEDTDKEDNDMVGFDIVCDVMKEESVFLLCENPCSCPALEYQWKDSATYNVIMNTLGIDSRVLLDGEGWRSSQPRYAPKSAASLMTPGGLLTPEPANTASSEEEKKNESESVSPAEFDWGNSGLTNPLADENGSAKIKGNSSPSVGKSAEDNNNIGAKSPAQLSREAQNVLDGLPLLNFMSSNFLNRLKRSK